MNNQQPLVSIIMNCYNSDAYLTEAIKSVINQTYQNWEIIFWDNQSSDKSAEIATQYDDPKIKYFYAPNHTALGEARNFALEQASGDFIAFLDCDDFWEAEKLQKQVEIFKNNPNIDLVYTNYWYFYESNMKKIKALKGKGIEGHGNSTFKKLLIKYPIGMSTVMISFKKLKSLDEWFDPQLRLIEEFDLFLRISYQGTIRCINEPLMSYRVHDNNQTIKLLDSWSQEYQYIVKKYARLFISFSNEYRKEIQYLIGLGNYIAGKYYFEQKMYHKAKSSFYSIRYSSIKTMLYYFISSIKAD